VLSEYLVGGLSPARMRQLAARVVTVRQLTDGASFVDTFRVLDQTFEFRNMRLMPSPCEFIGVADSRKMPSTYVACGLCYATFKGAATSHRSTPAKWRKNIFLSFKNYSIATSSQPLRFGLVSSTVTGPSSDWRKYELESYRFWIWLECLEARPRARRNRSSNPVEIVTIKSEPISMRIGLSSTT